MANASQKHQSGKGRRPLSRVTVACKLCRKRKRKCSGGPFPCKPCLLSQTPCDYDVNKPRHYPSVKLQNALGSLLRSIKYSSPENLQLLIHTIRHDSPIQEVVKAFRENMQGLLRAGYVGRDEVVSGEEVIAVALEQIPQRRSWPECLASGGASASSTSNQYGSPSYLHEPTDAAINVGLGGTLYEPSQAIFDDMFLSRAMGSSLQVESAPIEACEPPINIQYDYWPSFSDSWCLSQADSMYNPTAAPNDAAITPIPPLTRYGADADVTWSLTLSEHEGQHSPLGAMSNFP